MKCNILSGSSGTRMANTNLVSLLDGALIIILRSWGSNDYNQKFIDEIQHYLSSTEADVEVTTPFDYQENLSPLANRTRVAILLAHDHFTKSENKNEYLVGFEVTVLLQSKNELAWSSVGRFSIDKFVDEQLCTYLSNGSDLDTEVLLPVQLVGLEKAIDISSGSMMFNEKTRIVVSSVYRCKLQQSQTSLGIEISDVLTHSGCYWLAAISSS